MQSLLQVASSFFFFILYQHILISLPTASQNFPIHGRGDTHICQTFSAGGGGGTDVLILFQDKNSSNKELFKNITMEMLKVSKGAPIFHLSLEGMYVCTYIRMYICMYVRMYVCMYVHMYICTYVRIYVCT